MKAIRIDEYHKNGCHFYGHLVVVNYLDDMSKDPKWGTFNAGLTFDYMEKAQSIVKERYGDNFDTLLSIPELVIRLKD